MRGGHIILLSFLVAISIFFFKESNLGKDEYIAKIVSVDNTDLIQRGVSRIGSQVIIVDVLSKERKGDTLQTVNRLNGSGEYDEYYKVGDKALIRVVENNNRLFVTPISVYRAPFLMILLLIFSVSLILYAKGVGLKSLLSFLATIWLIYYQLIPRLLRGDSAIMTSLVFISFLTGIIIFSVAGFTKRGMVAFLGTITGLMVSIFLTHLFLDSLSFNGLTMPMAQGLLSTGNFNINLLDILYSGIIISASGAGMDIAMDMAVSMEEILENSPGISRKKLIKSGFNIGNAVIGTMATTLLLAYTGGNITMMMLLVERGLSLNMIINSKLMAVEIAKTLIGTISLLIVAPMTAFIASNVYLGRPKRNGKRERSLWNKKKLRSVIESH